MTDVQEKNIFSLADFKQHKAKLETQVAGDDSDLFTATMAKNQLLQEKLRKDRLKANQQVLRSYKIKGK